MAQVGDIRSWEDALNSRCNWGWLRGCFGPTISPTDLDKVVERRGHFLVTEVKRVGQDVPQGQMILLEALHHLPPFTVCVLEGDIDKHEITPRRIFLFGEGWQPATRASYRLFCSQWFARANRVDNRQFPLLPYHFLQEGAP